MRITGMRHRRPLDLLRRSMISRLQSMAGATGLEPATSGVTGRRSNQLSYAPAASTRAGSRTPPAGECQANPGQIEPSDEARKPALRHLDELKPALNALETTVDVVEPALHTREIDL